MKKIVLLLMFLYSLSGYSQVWPGPEGFEGSATNMPTGWWVDQNTVGSQKWTISTSSFVICEGLNAARMVNQTIPAGSKSEDYLITPKFTVPENGQFRFLSRQSQNGDQGTKYQIRVSTDADQKLLSAYSTIVEYTENQLNPTFNICEENFVDISAFAGQNIYVAIVRVFEPNPESPGGDACAIDFVNVVSKCISPTGGIATNIAATTATLDWADNTGNKWDIELVTAGNTPTGVPNYPGVTKPFPVTDLLPDTAYSFYVRSVCPDSNSDWAGPFNFKTFALGVMCEGAIIVPALPYQTAANTGNFGDNYDGSQGSFPACGANPVTTNYMTGNDVFYSYTADESGLISIKLTPTGPNSSIFVYSSCPPANPPATTPPTTPPASTVPCLAGVANTNDTQRVINNFAVTQGTTYNIVISSGGTTQTVGYTLVIQKEPCTPPVGASPIGTDITTTTAKLQWSNPTGATAWEVAMQPLGSPVPTGPGLAVSTNPYVYTDLTAGTQYQYYVRSVCPNGQFSSWAGPYPFNTLLCEDANKCLYEFRMTDSAANGWNNATMQVRQNGIVVQTIGSTFTTGAGPVIVKVPLCNDLPFDLFWNNAGTAPAQCAVAVVNSFGQTLFTKAAGVSGAGQIVYNDLVDCDTPSCLLVPTALTSTNVTTNAATLNWTAPSTTAWDVYIVPQGSDAPTSTSTPTYANITTKPFTVSTGLLADTCYDYYVRVVCSPNTPAWSVAGNFCTLPTCAKPTGLSVTNITKTSAVFNWEKGTVADTNWEILLVKATGPLYAVPTPAPPANYVPVAGDKTYLVSAASPFTATDLESATIYYYYIRTLCPGDDKSVWAGPIKFNTVTCDTAEKCNYTVVMTDAGGNGWDGARMQIRQNGIVVSTIGSVITGAGPNNATIALCPNVPFDLYWSVAGTKPGEVAVKVVNPFGDPIYTKLAGEGTPLTVLYNATGNCTGPTCTKPTALTVTNITSTTATLGWTQSGATATTKWEVYVVPTGTTPPVNGFCC